MKVALFTLGESATLRLSETILALLARRAAHGERIDRQGPTNRRFAVKQGRRVVEFDPPEGLAPRDGTAPKGFWLADKEDSWHPATGALDGESNVLRAEDIDAPVACPYAFCGKPDVNPINEDGFPAYPFRTTNGSN